ncbi:TPA: hypothetical protein ACY4SM_001103 [Clostridium perfringens]|uniref:Uncharacterized protein n=1 Tax=Clostridium perfringens TaxID=1502 RepID=A0A133N6V7_CLOPF|nr:hypothetical protein [Clostridium perfringens]EGT0012824.1 hypothetical protein [Clostridium perfringens]EGT3601367.1 hypothetical protein [Clostridium perfringens]EGT3605605.1 hypothetical protein [Clostridium perfringens]EGT4137652.1 hypothetical protein [Clostridium perfringens]EGT4143760.1 hypothetical protein [Clostridium perfringens]
MSKLLLDMVGKECKITFLGINEIKGSIISVDDDWIKFKYAKSSKVKIVKTCFISSILEL